MKLKINQIIIWKTYLFLFQSFSEVLIHSEYFLVTFKEGEGDNFGYTMNIQILDILDTQFGYTMNFKGLQIGK